ncbi:hypothetical protein [Peribacillus butanolivorans]
MKMITNGIMEVKNVTQPLVFSGGSTVMMSLPNLVTASLIRL